MAAGSICTRFRSHLVTIERLEKLQWRVTIDGRRLFTFCSEARARAAAKAEARRLDLVALEARERELLRR